MHQRAAGVEAPAGTFLAPAAFRAFRSLTTNPFMAAVSPLARKDEGSTARVVKIR